MEHIGVGSIKKIFGRQREPYGFLTIHHPEELKGDEAVFYLKDVIVASEEERRLLQGGMMVKFSYLRKPMDRMKAPCPYKAICVRPQDPMKYTGTVAKTSNGELVVFLEILFRQVRVHTFNQALDPGDRCTISINWKEMIRSIKENRDPFGNLLSVEEKFNSFFSTKVTPEKQCRQCKNSKPSRQSLNKSNLSHHNLSNLSLNSQYDQPIAPAYPNRLATDFSLFGSSIRPSIWGHYYNSPPSPESATSNEDPEDSEWYFRTIRMAEHVLNGSANQKLN